MFCRFFILRPVLSTVISLIILLIGSLAIFASPVAQYPNISPPSITISATFPGANSETLATVVAAPLEDQLSGISNMIYMTSSSANASNSVNLTIYFEVGTDLDFALSDILNRVNTALPQLPTAVSQQGITVRKKSPDLFLIMGFYSKTGSTDLLYLSNYVQRYVYPVLSQTSGVGVATIVGNRSFSIRVWLDPQKLAYYGISANEVTTAIQEQNRPFTIGLMGMPPTDGTSQFQFMINTQGYMTDVSQFEKIIIKAEQNGKQNRIIRLEDLGTVSLDGQQFSTNMTQTIKNANGVIESTPMVGMLLYLSPGANQISTKSAVNKTMNTLVKNFPADIGYYNQYDTSIFVKASIEKVIDTLRDAFILVFLIVFLFIQKFRSTLIPMLAIPISIIGTFAGTYILGFSINTLTLFGIVLAIGIVVDDAIVVLENTERIMEDEGLDSTQAAIKAMEEVSSPVIAIVLVLNAVFIPVAFLGGFTGVLFQQFAVTIAISVFLSGIVALTFTPALCAVFLKNNTHKNKPKLKFFELFDKVLNKTRDFYIKIVKFLINHIKTTYSLFVLVMIITIGLFGAIPTSLIPLEDTGNFFSGANLPAAASLDRTNTQAIKVSKFLSSLPGVDRVVSITGLDILDNGTNKTNAALIASTLKPWDERTKQDNQLNAIINDVNKYCYISKGVNCLAFNRPPISGLSTTGGVTFYLQSSTDISPKEIYADSMKLIKALMEYPSVSYAKQFYDVSVPELYVDLDRDKAKLYGININDVFDTLQSTFGTHYVNYFEKWNDLWWVILQSDYKFRNTPELLNTIYVKNSSGKMIPVGSIASTKFINGPEVVTRYNDYLASQIIVNPKDGYTSGDVMKAVTDAVYKTLGSSYILQWSGASYQEAQAGSSSIIAVTLGIIMVFLILAALYELWRLPFSVLLALPFALFGAAIMLLLTKRPNDIFFQVSLITLIGLSAKNAILIVEFALDGVRKHGMNPIDAAIEGARLRFRPILMTSLAFIIGTLPLVFATGAGANSQHSVGTGIVGGMLGSTFLATLFVPFFFAQIMNFKQQSNQKTLV